MDAIQIMNEEHKYILRMLKVVRKICLKFMNEDKISYEDLDNVIDFIKNYSDKHHHKKEEDILFNKMVQHIGQVAEKVVNQGMIVEHDLGRLYIKDLVEALEKFKNGDKESKLDIIANAISYTHLLDRHINKEDKVIYKFAQRELSSDILEFINNECENFEANNKEIKNKYISILKELENKY